jgi:hypothetical protein
MSLIFQSSSTLDYYLSDCQQKKNKENHPSNEKCEVVLSDGVNDNTYNYENQMFNGCKVNILCQV